MAIEAFLGTRPQKAFLGTIVIQAILVIAMVAVVFNLVENNVEDSTLPKFKTIPCYLALFAFAEVFEVFIAVDALRLRNTIQLVGILLFHAAMIVMSGLQIGQTSEALTGAPTCDGCLTADLLWDQVLRYLVVVPIILAISLVVLVWVTSALFQEFGWAVFHAIGADPRMKAMYQYYQIMVCFLKFDFFFFIGVTMQLLILVISANKTEFALTVIAIPVVLILLILCAFGLRREIWWIMLVSLILMIASETYFVYKLISFYIPDKRAQYDTIRGSLTTFTVVAALMLLFTFAVGVRCFADFGRGLKKSKMNDPEKARRARMTPGNTPGTMTERNSSYLGGVPLQPRISIE